MTRPRTSLSAPARLLSKVPEVTVFFWVIKVLCTTVGESAADCVNETLGFGLGPTTLLFGVLLAVALVVQLRLGRYVPAPYWTVVVLISVFGTLVTDNLTDGLGVDLALSTPVFAVLLALTFAAWYRAEHTLSIHAVDTRRREGWYWLVVGLTFALGTAAGDLLVDRLGFSLLAAVVVYAVALALVLLAYRLGAGPVLTFWVGYVLTRPLGGSTGDWLSGDRSDGGVGLGTLGTRRLFLLAIVGTVCYLTLSRVDVMEGDRPSGRLAPVPVPRIHPDEVPVATDVVHRLLQDQAPDLAGPPLVRLDTWGTDHVLHRLGDDLVVRSPKVGRAADQGAREQQHLPRLAPALPVQVPVPVLVGQPGHGYPFPWTVAPWLPGAPPDPATADLGRLAGDLAGLLRALSAVDPAGAPPAAPGARGGPLAALDASVRGCLAQLAGEGDTDALLQVWEDGLQAPAHAGPGAWLHGDLQQGNLLVTDGTLTGVVDWGGLVAGDPSADLLAAWSLLDAPARAALREALDVDDAAWRRGRAWAVSAAVHALPYYRLTNPDIVARSERTVSALLEGSRAPPRRP